jgi:hypothetical protein
MEFEARLVSFFDPPCLLCEPTGRGARVTSIETARYTDPVQERALIC